MSDYTPTEKEVRELERKCSREGAREQFGISEQLPYTPTTEEVKESYFDWNGGNGVESPIGLYEEFDRWLDETKKLAIADFFTENGLSYRARALKAKAWQEGHDAGVEDATFEPVDHALNPYRSWETE